MCGELGVGRGGFPRQYADFEDVVGGPDHRDRFGAGIYNELAEEEVTCK